MTDEKLEALLTQAAREYDELKMAYYDRIYDEALMKEHLTPAKLTPSAGGKECLGNGKWPGYACQCPDCDYYETCFPDWEGHK